MHRGHFGHGHLVKIENGLSKSATIIINIYIYLIVSKNRVSEIENDHFDHDHFDHAVWKDTVDSPMTYVLSYLCCRVDLGLLGNIIIFIMQSYKIIL